MTNERKPLFDNEDVIVSYCEAINEGAPRGEIFDNLDTIEEVFFEMYKKITQDEKDFNDKIEAEKQAAIQAEIDKWTEFSLEDCPTFEVFLDWAQETLDDTVREETPHGEQGTDEEEGYFRWNGKEWLVTYTPDWNRYDKQYYYIDNMGDNIKAEELI